MTQRLYYDDAYLTTFTATVTGVTSCDEGYITTLDQSAFYPTSGGQPFDTGRVGDAKVLDVYPDEFGDVVHVLDRALTQGSKVSCAIDWARRFDHMQQHAADHMIAGALYSAFNAYTIGLHVGAELSTIDVELPDGRTHLSASEIDMIERTVNGQIQENLPIRCFFPSEEELPDVPFRKRPTVKEHVRAVMIGAVECVACGGTHPRATGEIGLIKILDTRPSRGKMRLTFLAGMRAVRDYQEVSRAANAAAAALSCATAELPDALGNKLELLKEAQWALARQRKDAALVKAEALLRDAESVDGVRVVDAVLEGLDRAGLCDAASRIAQTNDAVALLAGSAGENAIVVFARGAGVSRSMGELMARVTKALGGKGGGRPDFAQGAADGTQALRMAKDDLLKGQDK